MAPLFDALSSVLEIVIDTMKPTFFILEVAFRAIAVAVQSVTIGLRQLYIWFLKAVDYIPGVDMEKEVEQLENAQAREVAQLQEMMTAQQKQTEATERQTEAANAATESLTNVPSGIKIAVKRFGAMQAGMGRSRFNDFVQRPGQAATHFSPDDTIIGVQRHEPLRRQRANNRHAKRPHQRRLTRQRFFRNLLDLVQRDHKRGGNALGGAYQGRP